MIEALVVIAIIASLSAAAALVYAPRKIPDDVMRHSRGFGSPKIRLPLPNVWLGVSAERQKEADERIPHLLQTPAAVRFVSCEPLLGPIDLSARPFVVETPAASKLDWVIAGGESGPKARPMHPDWARSIRDQCRAAGVAYFFKQWGEWKPYRPLPGGDLGGDVRAGRVRIVHPSGRSDVEISNATGGRNTEVGSRYMIRVGKKAAGRLLDGREWNEFPKTESAGVIEGSVLQDGMSSPDPNQKEAAGS